MNPQQNGPTPPTIVADAEQPHRALGAFVAQELEHWGFSVEPVTDGDLSLLLVHTGRSGEALHVSIQRAEWR